jgi:tetratricopeptide (TPR) repeat protein
VAARGEAQADVEVSTLVVPAWRLRWQAPEIALVLGERAVALAAARRDEVDRLRAESLVVFASNQIGRGIRIAERALDALKAAEAASEHETAWRLRVELAWCARTVGAPLTGFAAVRPVLESEGVPDALRASALVQASECLLTIGRGDELVRALEEADRLYSADPVIDEDTRLLLRARLRGVAAAQHRRWGDLAAAITAGREGLELLGQLSDPAADSGQVRGGITFELACALMDSNEPALASEVAAPLLDRPVRAPSAGPIGWLRLALATRLHLPNGRVDLARELLREAADSAERHQLETLHAESLLALAHVHELSGELGDALTDLRAAHAAERRHARAVYAVRVRLAAEFAGVPRQAVGLHEQFAALLGSTGASTKQEITGRRAAEAAVTAELKQWRSAQLQKADGPRLKRSRRAAEDMTVEGISAARANAADRWRMVRPFGEAGAAVQKIDVPKIGARNTGVELTSENTAHKTPGKTPENTPAKTGRGGRRRAEDRPADAPAVPAWPTESDIAPVSTSDQSEASSGGRTVPATGLIAAAGAMRSGRRRAAREAAEKAVDRHAVPDNAESTETGADGANVLDALKAAGLLDTQKSRGRRRRAPDAEDTPAPTTPSRQSGASDTPLAPPSGDRGPHWKVHAPSRLRGDDRPGGRSKPSAIPAAAFLDTPTTIHRAVGADGLPVPEKSAPVKPDTGAAEGVEDGIGSAHSSLATGFARELTPTVHVPEQPEPNEEPDEKPLPVPEPDEIPAAPMPDEIPAVPDPHEAPSVPVPDEVPKPPSHGGYDVVPSTFLTAADVEADPEDEPAVTDPVAKAEPTDFVGAAQPETPAEPSGRPGSRRSPSELTMAELLAEALVAYETGRRSDAEFAGSGDEAGTVMADWMSTVENVPAADAAPAEQVSAETDAERTGLMIPVAPAEPDNETTAPIRRLPGDAGDPSRFRTWTLPES